MGAAGFGSQAAGAPDWVGGVMPPRGEPDVIRIKRPSSAHAVAAVALVVALGGTAWAAANITSKDIVNGTILSKDISNGTLKSVDLSDEAAKLTSSDVAPGTTLFGSFFFTNSVTSPDSTDGPAGSIDFGGFRLPTPPEVRVVDTDAAAGSVPQCPGSVSDPSAAPGFLCLYVMDMQAMSEIQLLDATDPTFTHGTTFTFATNAHTFRVNGGNVSRFGAHVLTHGTPSNVHGVRGVWAVTAANP
jgi:hypothetical protein